MLTSLTIYYTHKPGGFCKRLYRLLAGLAARGADVHYLTLDPPPPGALAPAVQIHLVPFWTKRRTGALFWLTFTLWAPLALLLAAKKFRPNRIVVFGAYYSAVACVAAAILRIPIVLFVRSLVFMNNRITGKPYVLCLLSNILERWGISRASRILTMSKSMTKELNKFVGRELKNVSYLPNDVPPLPPPAPFAPTPHLQEIQARYRQGTITLLISGVFDARKNLDLVLRALRILKDQSESERVLLVIAGDGPLLAQHKDQARQWGLSNVLFLGWCDSLEPYYPFISLVLHPSLHEGMPNSVLEAWSHGVPALVAPTPELRELAGSDELTIPAASPSALAQKLALLVQEPSKIRFLKDLTCLRAVEFKLDWEASASEIILGTTR